VVNTVGKTGLLGEHIRCVVSVSMLTEGWDANTVTHILGLRAFKSQLLCEQVAGRALRRRNYVLQGYDKEGNPIPKGSRAKVVTLKFPPEYAHIIGIPFKNFKGGTTEAPSPVDRVYIVALPEREEQYEITFPNVVGYRVDHKDGPILADFSEVEHFIIDTSSIPVDTKMTTAFSSEQEILTTRERVETLRDQELVYLITQKMISKFYRDDDGHPHFHRFAQMKRVVEEWYCSRVKLLGERDERFRRLIYYMNPDSICSHINRGIMSATSGSDIILPVLNYYNKFGSTRYVRGETSKEVYPTLKSHVNYVVADTEKWEQIAAKTLDEIDEVLAYVKNAFLGFAIPYVNASGEDKQYFPDYIARCRKQDGSIINLIIEITGMNMDKQEKRWYVEHRWLPAVNAVHEKYGYDEWRFIEIANDIRDIKPQLAAAINANTDTKVMA